MNRSTQFLIIPDINRLSDSVSIAEKYGVAFEYNDFYYPNVYGDPAETDRRIELYKSLDRDRSSDTLHGAFFDVSIASTDKNIRGHSRRLVEQSAEIASRLGIKGVVYHTGLISKLNFGAYREAWLNAAVEVFKPLCKKYPDLEFYMENTFEATPDVFVELMQRMSDTVNFKLCLDYAHAVLTSTPPEKWFDALYPYIGHMHINDNDLERDLHLVPGEGKIDYSLYCRLCEKHKVNASVLLELTGVEAQIKALEFMKKPFPPKVVTTKKTFDTILDIAISLSKETDKRAILNTILNESMNISGCDAGTLYILREDGLHFSLMKTVSQNIDKGGDGDPIDLPPVPIKKENISAYTVLTKQPIHIDDVYATDAFDFSGPKKYDKMTGYRTGSMLCVPLLNQENEVIGVIQLINALDGNGNIKPFAESSEHIIFALSSLAAIELCNIQYMEEMREQMWSFTEAMAEAIDERTPYNANHIRNVASYAARVADYINYLHEKGETEEFFDDRRKDCLIMAALLHDIGKLVIPLSVMNKPTRLGKEEEALQKRFELLSLKYEVLRLRGVLSDDKYEQKIAELNRITELCNTANNAGFLTDEMMAKLQDAFTLAYDHEGEHIPYFTDKEKEFLSIRKGTLTERERHIMQGHVEATEKILEKVHFNSYFKRSRLYAAQHHEFLNGTGYPRKLKADDLPLESRILAVADIYDALYCADRPYKKPMPREKAIAILYDMARCGQLDETVCRYIEAATDT